MDKLSKLIKEAKPLYKTRKRNRTIALGVVSLCVPVMMLSAIIGVYQTGSNIYLSIADNTLTTELTQDEFNLYR